MRLDLYYIFRQFQLTNFGHPIILDVLRIWAESIGWKVRVAVCKEQEVDFSSDADVVGISVYTQTAPAAYRVSDKLRERGKIVLLGGPHFRGPATFEEAASHCHAIVTSICENQWKRLLNDIAYDKIVSGDQKALFVVDEQKRFRYPDHFYGSSRNLKWYQYPSVPTSIGCPYNCCFCSPYLPGEYILRDINTIYAEVAHIRGKVIFLSDATFGANKRFTFELMKALAPLEKKFMVEMPLERLQDRETLDVLAFGGVKWIITGIESLSLRLKKHGTANLQENLKRLTDNAHKCDLFIQGSLICGMDGDGPECFDDIYEFWNRSNMDSIMLDILTPYPNTKIHSDLEKQGRIFDTNWEHYDYYHLVYRPLKMTVDQLIEGFIELYKSLLDRRSILVDSVKVYRNKGIKTASTGLIAYNIYSKFEAKRKEKALRKNHKQISLSLHS
jgi:radical SAM superfamily enzyme YgiQ (UPF0313 family)